MELYEDAVSLALGIDIELAKRVANKPRDPETKKNLWLTIVKHLVEGKNNVKGYAMIRLHLFFGLVNLLTLFSFFLTN